MLAVSPEAWILESDYIELQKLMKSLPLDKRVDREKQKQIFTPFARRFVDIFMPDTLARVNLYRPAYPVAAKILDIYEGLDDFFLRLDFDEDKVNPVNCPNSFQVIPKAK